MTETEIIVCLLAFMVLVAVIGGVVVLIKLIGVEDAIVEVNDVAK